MRDPSVAFQTHQTHTGFYMDLIVVLFYFHTLYFQWEHFHDSTKAAKIFLT